MLDFGWQVSTTDEGDAGQVVGAVYEPGSWSLARIVVRRGAMATRDIVVPATAISSLGENLVALSGSADELEAYPDFRVRRYVEAEDLEPMEDPEEASGVVLGTAPAPMTGDPMNPWTVGGTPLIEEDRLNIPEGFIAISQGQEVFAQDGTFVGNVARLIYAGDELTGIVVRPDHVFGSGNEVPVLAIAEYDSVLDRLVLGAAPEQVDALPDAPVS